MALDNANYIDELSITDPAATDLVSQGDDQIRTVKRAVKQSFPSVDIAVNAVHTSSAAPAVSISEGLVWIDTSAGAGNHVIKIHDGSSFITLPFSVEAAQTVDINAGTIDGTIIGGATPAAITTTDLTATTADINAGTIDGTVIGGASAAAITTTDLTATTADINAGTVDAVLGGTTPAAVTGTTLKANTSLELATGATVTGVDNGALGSSATLLATQGAIKTYVDAQVTGEDLDFQGDSGTGAVDLDSQTLDIAGGSGITTTASGQTLTVAGDDATTSAKGVASFSSDNFSVSSGAVTIKDAGVANAELDDMAANTIKVRDANSSGVPSDKALATTQILIGDGTGFTAASLSSDATMTNAGAVTVTGIQGRAVTTTAPSNDQYMKYSSASSEWQMVTIVGTDKLTTKGDLLVYNTVDSETRLPIGINDYVLTADSTATNGLAWKEAVDNAAAMALALGG
jgi:hypothetical protein